MIKKKKEKKVKSKITEGKKRERGRKKAKFEASVEAGRREEVKRK